jgi:hypothetical protein
MKKFTAESSNNKNNHNSNLATTPYILLSLATTPNLLLSLEISTIKIDTIERRSKNYSFPPLMNMNQCHCRLSIKYFSESR